MNDDPVFPVLDAETPAGAERLGRLAGRLAALEALESAAAREKTVAAFGEPLSPREVVTRIVTAVRERGDEAVAEFSEKLDGVSMAPDDFRVPEAEVRKALERAPAPFVAAAERAAGNIREFQKRLLPRQVALRAPEGPGGAGGGPGNDGLSLGARWSAVERAACYIPGGVASYPSSVLMNAIPAQVAGVGRLVLSMPPGSEGAGNPLTLAAAALVGCTEVYRVGGVQAVAAFAFGTETIPKVDVIAGPGNIYVMLAKREVFGHVNIDMLAGPSEVLVLADAAADPELAAADLLSQAEHDAMASAILVTPSREQAERTRQALLRQLDAAPRGEVARESLANYGLALVVRDMDAACRAASDIAPEHLEILASDPEALAASIRNAGAVFLGPWAPESLGDYAAGPSHTLPTGGAARFMSGLGPMSFMKRTSLIGATREGLRRELGVIDEFARADRLPAHGESAKRRFG